MTLSTETVIAKATAKLTFSWVLFVETGYATDGKTDNVVNEHAIVLARIKDAKLV